MKILLLDMDGVLVQLHDLYLEIFGNLDFNRDNFNKAVFEHKIFEIAKPTNEFAEIMNTVNQCRYNTQIAILSSLGTSDENPTRQVEIRRQKHAWVKQYINFDIPIFLVSNKKYKCHFANKFTYLIDDTPSNIHEFENFGGRGIIHTHDTVPDTIKFINNI